MSIKRYGVEGGKGAGGQQLPFARAAEAGGWLYVSGQVPMVNGEVIAGNIVAQSRQAILNLLGFPKGGGFGLRWGGGGGGRARAPPGFRVFKGVMKKFLRETPAW